MPPDVATLDDGSRLLTTAEVAGLFGVRPQTIRKRLSQGRFAIRPVARRWLGGRRINLWSADEARAAAATQIEMLAKIRGSRRVR